MKSYSKVEQSEIHSKGFEILCQSTKKYFSAFNYFKTSLF